MRKHVDNLSNGLSRLSSLELQREAIRRNEKISREETIRLGQIKIEPDAITDHERAALLAQEILKGGWRQTERVLVRTCVDDSGQVCFEVLNGFHRVAGLKEVVNADFAIKAICLYNCTELEKIAQRILAANSVLSIRFARTGKWAKEAWQLTSWAQKITAVQAFQLATFSNSGKNSGLTIAESKEIKEWCNNQAKIWRTKVSTIWHTVRIHEVADPELILKTRGGSFGKGQLSITPEMLGKIAFAFPRQFDIQKAIALAANRFGLSVKEMENLITIAKSKKISSIDAIDSLIAGRDWKATRRTSHSGKQHPPHYPETQGQSIDMASGNFLIASLRLATGTTEELATLFLSSLNILPDELVNLTSAVRHTLRKWTSAPENKNLTSDPGSKLRLKKDFAVLSKTELVQTLRASIAGIATIDNSLREDYFEIIKHFPIEKLNTTDYESVLATFSSLLQLLKYDFIGVENRSVIVDFAIEIFEIIATMDARKLPAWNDTQTLLEEVVDMSDEQTQMSYRLREAR